MLSQILSQELKLLMPIIVSLEELADLQKEDEELKTILNNSSFKFQKLILSGSITPIFCDSTENIRP